MLPAFGRADEQPFERIKVKRHNLIHPKQPHSSASWQSGYLFEWSNRVRLCLESKKHPFSISRFP